MKVLIKAFVVVISLLFVGIGNSVYAGPALLQDAYTVTGTSASVNYGSSPSLIVAANATSYLQFSVNSYVPTGIIGKDVAKATLKIFVNSVTTAGSFNVSSLNSNWIEETIRGNYRPIIGLKVAGPIAIPSALAKHWISIDITHQVQDWLDGISINNGLALIAANNINVSFDSKESATYSQAPEIDIIMAKVPGIQGPKGDIGPKGATGSIGPIGPAGATGAQGIQGVKGNTGATGPIGPVGTFQAGTEAGQTLYWNGTAWVTIKAGANNTVFRFCKGVPTWVVANANCPLVIGDTGPAGGKVFYITEGGLHGLEAAPVNQADIVPWGCYGTSIAGTSTAVGTGAANTAKIVAGCAEANTAAKVADAYSLNGYDDWYLPSKDELDLLYDQKTVVGVFANANYWSSTESDIYNAWYQYFGDGSGNGYEKYSTLPVRAVRAF